MKARKFAGIILLSALSSVAGAIDVAVERVVVFPVSALSAPDGWRPAVGEKVKIRCERSHKTTPGEQSHIGSVRGRILVDGEPIEIGKSTAKSFLAMGDATAYWFAVIGPHKIRCEVDYPNEIAEVNESNNAKEISINVRGPQRAAQGSAQVMASAGLKPPNAKSKACKATLYTSVQLDKSQFTGVEGVPEANAAKMTMDLVSSDGVGNYVHCKYQSVGRDVTFAYTYACTNARSAGPKHVYACD